MKVDTAILTLLKEAVAQKFDRTPRTPSDFEELAHQIFLSTGRTIGVSTLKRLWGYVRTEQGTTFSTLSLISRYAGYRDWDTFCEQRTCELYDDESDFSPDKIINCASLPIGETLILKWGKCKSIILKKIEHPVRFKVLRSENLKLKMGDVVDISSIAIGKPLIAGYCIRNGQIMGSYKGARRSGIASIEAYSQNYD